MTQPTDILFNGTAEAQERIYALEAKIERLTAEIRKAYRDRAVRDAALGADWDGVMVIGGDPTWPEWGVFYYELASGQVSSHVHPDELFIFDGFPRIGENRWDGHTRELAHERYLAHKLTRLGLWEATGGGRRGLGQHKRYEKVGDLLLPAMECE